MTGGPFNLLITPRVGSGIRPRNLFEGGGDLEELVLRGGEFDFEVCMGLSAT